VVVAFVALLYASCADNAPSPKPDARATPTANTTTAATSALKTPAAPATAPNARAEDWNDAQIAWQSYDAGISRAKIDNKPVCLVFFTHWCPHCRNYSKVFSDPRIVARAKDFVMIRLNADDEAAISKAHSPDGAYVPRTFFLASDGKVLADVHAPRPQYVHFYDEHNPESLLGGMEEALRKVRAM